MPSQFIAIHNVSASSQSLQMLNSCDNIDTSDVACDYNSSSNCGVSDTVYSNVAIYEETIAATPKYLGTIDNECLAATTFAVQKSVKLLDNTTDSGCECDELSDCCKWNSGNIDKHVSYISASESEGFSETLAYNLASVSSSITEPSYDKTLEIDMNSFDVCNLNENTINIHTVDLTQLKCYDHVTVVAKDETVEDQYCNDGDYSSFSLPSISPDCVLLNQAFNCSNNGQDTLREHTCAVTTTAETAETCASHSTARAQADDEMIHDMYESQGTLPICRICHMSGADIWEGAGGASELISPCNCSGSMKFIHRSCLMHWIEVSSRKGGVGAHTVRSPVTGANHRAPVCELCLFPYRGRKRFHANGQWLLPRIGQRDKLYHLVFVLMVSLMLVSGVATVFCFKYDSGARYTLRSAGGAGHGMTATSQTPGLSVGEIVTVVCGLSFFLAFFVAMYVQMQASQSFYELVSLFYRMNHQWQVGDSCAELPTRGAAASKAFPV